MRTIAEMLKKRARIEVRMKRHSIRDWYGSWKPYSRLV